MSQCPHSGCNANLKQQQQQKSSFRPLLEPGTHGIQINMQAKTCMYNTFSLCFEKN